MSDRFDRLYRENIDPWGYRSTEYEREKYASTIAALPREIIGWALSPVAPLVN